MRKRLCGHIKKYINSSLDGNEVERHSSLILELDVSGQKKIIHKVWWSSLPEYGLSLQKPQNKIKLKDSDGC